MAVRLPPTVGWRKADAYIDWNGERHWARALAIWAQAAFIRTSATRMPKAQKSARLR
jgi:hypothetical protein